MKTGIELIAEERERQIEEEGWTPGHDAKHTNGAIAQAGACYALFSVRPSLLSQTISGIPRLLPWQNKWWKPSDDRIRNLVKAGALIAAEIDRLNAANNEQPV